MRDLPDLHVHRLHPDGVRIVRAEKLLNGEHVKSSMMQIGLHHCGPLRHANSSGWWVFSPLDLDVAYLGEGNWQFELRTPYGGDEAQIIRRNLRPEDKYRDATRERIAFGRVEPDTVQIWTGCILRTPPGWVLLLVPPINFVDGFKRPFHVQQGVLETDWLPYDVWLNIKFHREHEHAQIRRSDTVPLAQLIPMRREAYDREVRLFDNVIDRADPAGNQIWLEWQGYNYEKWLHRGRKDPTTYFRRRRVALAEDQRRDGR
jgi:Family of unknown function (DUF6065)